MRDVEPTFRLILTVLAPTSPLDGREGRGGNTAGLRRNLEERSMVGVSSSPPLHATFNRVGLLFAMGMAVGSCRSRVDAGRRPKVLPGHFHSIWDVQRSPCRPKG